MRLLEGRSALVSGGASGIGRAACMSFAREGAAVCVVDRDIQGARRTCELIADAGGRASAILADVSLEHDVLRMMDEGEHAYGRITCYFNNAGIGTTETNSRKKLLAEIALADWQRMLDVNLTGVFLCLKAQLARLGTQGGAIVNTASIGGLTALQGAAAYVASKHGVIGLTRSAAIEYAHAGIRVNAVCPGHIVTPLIGEVPASDTRVTRVPMGRCGTPEEIADLVTWLCSSQASFVTGATFTADGGRLAGG